MKKRLILSLMICLCSILIFACGKKDNGNKQELEEYGLTPHKYNLDYSEKLSDLSVIKEQKITEARIYGYDQDQMYSTKDEAVLENLVDRISGLDLKEVEEAAPDPGVGFSELFLMNGDKVAYHIVYSTKVTVGNKQYEAADDTVVNYWGDVMEYCKQTFWR